MSPQPVPESYAQAAQNRLSVGDDEGTLWYAANRNNSTSSAGRAQRPSIVGFEDPLPGPSRPPIRPPLGSHSRRPSSIAQVLSEHVFSKISSRPASTSEPISRLSSSTNIQTFSIEEEPSPRSGRKKKKKKSRSNHRRKRSTSTTYGDLLAGQTRGIETPSSQIENPTPLAAAIKDEDAQQVRKLLFTYDPNVNSESGLPLQAAAITGNEDIIRLLLHSGHFNVNARNSQGRTALYEATARGYDSISKLLLEHQATPLSSRESRVARIELNRWQKYKPKMVKAEDPPLQNTQTLPTGKLMMEPEENSDTSDGPDQRPSVSRGISDDGDYIYRLEASSFENVQEMEDSVNQRRQKLQQRGEWVTGPIQTPQLSQEEKEILDQHRYARYPGFGFEAPTVEFDFAGNGKHRILRQSLDDLLYGPSDAETNGDDSGSARNTTVRWYHLPANNLGWAEDLIQKIYEKRSPKEQQKRDVILRREPFASIDHNNINATLLDPRPQSRSLRPQYRSITLDREGNTKLSSCISMHMPFAHWETEESRAEMHHVMEVVRTARKEDINRDKATPKKLPDFKTIESRTDWSKNEKMLCAYLYNSPPVHPRRTLDQFYYHMLEDTEHRDQDQVITRFYHNEWKRDHHLPEDDEESKFAMSSANKPKFPFSLDPPKDPKLQMLNGVAEGSSHSSSPSPLQSVLKSRRSTKVDESEETETLPREQRYVLMVDQLWLWILDENTIITSFPQNWIHEDDQHKNIDDDMDVLKSIYQYLSLVNRPPLETVYDIAQLIVYKCLAAFCTKSTPYAAMQILDVYEGAIATVTDKETKIFSEFAAKSKQKFSHEQLSSGSRDQAEELYNIDEEIEQLKEIKDIQDELHILSVLLEQQGSVLYQAAKALEKPQGADKNMSNVSLPMSLLRENVGQEAPYSSKNNFAKLHSMIIEQQKRRKGLEVQAEQANKALNHLLDLKQKQANVSEARSARWTAESTKQQGNIMVLFTLVTIVFAPLSLMVTIFQLNVVEFPANLHLGYVIKYMFVVSIAVIVPLLGLVVYTTRIAIWNLLLRIERRMENVDWFYKRRRQRRHEELRGDYYETDDGTEVLEEGKMNVRERIWRKGSKEKGFDTESGGSIA